MMSKVAEGKGKTCGKNGKNAKCAEVQDSESTERIDGQLSKLLFFVQNLDASVELRQY